LKGKSRQGKWGNSTFKKSGVEGAGNIPGGWGNTEGSCVSPGLRWGKIEGGKDLKANVSGKERGDFEGVKNGGSLRLVPPTSTRPGGVKKKAKTRGGRNP